MKYVPIPVALLGIGQPLPVDVWSATGQLLLRKGHPVTSEEHREKLHAHQASATQGEALAWLYENGRVTGRETDDEGRTHVVVRLHPAALGRFERQFG